MGPTSDTNQTPKSGGQGFPEPGGSGSYEGFPPRQPCTPEWHGDRESFWNVLDPNRRSHQYAD